MLHITQRQKYKEQNCQFLICFLLPEFDTERLKCVSVSDATLIRPCSTYVADYANNVHVVLERWETKNTYRIGKRVGKRSLGRLKWTPDVDTKVHLRKLSCNEVKCIEMADDFFVIGDESLDFVF
jgi:hypothetical protein